MAEEVENSPLPKNTSWKLGGWFFSFVTLAISLIIPAVTAITAYFNNERDYNRAIIEQQNQIRQNYLNILFTDKIKPQQEVQIFKLLSKFSSDSELQQWAKEELRMKERNLDSLAKKVGSLQIEVSKLLATIGDIKDQLSHNKITLL